MPAARDPLELFWDAVLSREDARVRAAAAPLDAEARAALLAHLRRMAGEPGWHPEQRASAQAALRALGALPGDANHSPEDLI